MTLLSTFIFDLIYLFTFIYSRNFWIVLDVGDIYDVYSVGGGCIS